MQIPTSGVNKSRGVSSLGAVSMGCHFIFKFLPIAQIHNGDCYNHSQRPT